MTAENDYDPDTLPDWDTSPFAEPVTCAWHPERVASGQVRTRSERGGIRWRDACDACADEYAPTDWRPFPEDQS